MAWADYRTRSKVRCVKAGRTDLQVVLVSMIESPKAQLPTGYEGYIDRKAREICLLLRHSVTHSDIFRVRLSSVRSFIAHIDHKFDLHLRLRILPSQVIINTTTAQSEKQQQQQNNNNKVV